MRTTLTLDNDVADLTRAIAERTGQPFRAIINNALRRGLPQLRQPAQLPPYRTKPHKMGPPLTPLDNIQEVPSRPEGENAR